MTIVQCCKLGNFEKVVVGTITYDGAVLNFDVPDNVRTFVENLPVFTPDGRELTIEDGEEWLHHLPGAWRGLYSWAEEVSSD